jgi:hypothetical protein
MFNGFIRQQIKTQETMINLVRGGSGYPILLLHGYPQTHVCWHRVAPILDERLHKDKISRELNTTFTPFTPSSE